MMNGQLMNEVTKAMKRAMECALTTHGPVNKEPSYQILHSGSSYKHGTDNDPFKGIIDISGDAMFKIFTPIRYSKEDIELIREQRNEMYARVKREQHLISELEKQVNECRDVIINILLNASKYLWKDKYGNVIAIFNSFSNRMTLQYKSISFNQDIPDIVSVCSLPAALENLILNNRQYNPNNETFFTGFIPGLISKYTELVSKNNLRYLLEVKDIAKHIKKVEEKHIPTEEEIQAANSFNVNEPPKWI